MSMRVSVRNISNACVSRKMRESWEVYRGVVLNDHDLKMLELLMFVTGQYGLNLFVLRHIFVRQFTHCQFLCVTEILYVCWLKLVWT